MAVDTLLNNRYAISGTDIKPIGGGGMAAIYEGVDTETGRTIAAKTLLPAYQGDSGRRKRFRQEGEILLAAQHTNVVEVLDVVDDLRGSWIVMEMIEGRTLGDMLKDEGAFDPKTVNEWLAQICAALENMHQLGYVHLDIKPQNILLNDDNVIKVIDFGIAQKAFAMPKREKGNLLGTPAYMSPEHAANGQVTPLSDTYSLGCVAFELLTDKQIFSERGELRPEETIRIRQDSVPELPTSVSPDLELPIWVDQVVANAIMPNPEDRYPSITAFAEAFNDYANPPLFRFRRPDRMRREEEEPVVVEAPRSVPPTQVAVPVENRTPREPTRAGRWVRKELRNVRRAIVMFALMLSLIFAAPMVGGSTAFDWALGLIPGSTTEVVGDNYRLRAGPSTNSETLHVMPEGQQVRVTGSPVVASDGLWWPVSTEIDGERENGWAFDDGLKRTWLMNRSAGFEEAQDSWSNRWDSFVDLLPG